MHTATDAPKENTNSQGGLLDGVVGKLTGWYNSKPVQMVVGWAVIAYKSTKEMLVSIFRRAAGISKRISRSINVGKASISKLSTTETLIMAAKCVWEGVQTLETVRFIANLIMW